MWRRAEGEGRRGQRDEAERRQEEGGGAESKRREEEEEEKRRRKEYATHVSSRSLPASQLPVLAARILTDRPYGFIMRHTNTHTHTHACLDELITIHSSEHTTHTNTQVQTLASKKRRCVTN